MTSIAARPVREPGPRTIHGKTLEQVQKELAAPFHPDDIEWRFQASGTNDRGPWAMVLAYITNRAIMDRLDEVVGIGNWQNDFRPWELGTDKGSLGVLCGIGVRFDDGDWVWKWDGAEQPKERGGGTQQPVAVKGGFSASMKRAGAEWGIGRYLYHLSAGWARFHANGEYENSIEKVYYKWSPPVLPAWALPGGSGKPEQTAKPVPLATAGNTPASGEQRPAPAPSARGGEKAPAAADEPKSDEPPFYPQGKYAPTKKQVDLYRKMFRSHVWTEQERAQGEKRLRTKKCTREEIGKWIDGMQQEMTKRKDAEKRAAGGESLSADDALERAALESDGYR